MNLGILPGGVYYYSWKWVRNPILNLNRMTEWFVFIASAKERLLQEMRELQKKTQETGTLFTKTYEGEKWTPDDNFKVTHRISEMANSDLECSSLFPFPWLL